MTQEHRPETRIEHDSMGAVQVPKDALYGSQTQRALENFPIGDRPFPPAFLEAMARIKECAAASNMELGLLSARLGQAIRSAAKEVAEGEWRAHFPLTVYQTGSGTSTNMNMNEVVARLANLRLGIEPGGEGAAHPNDHVNLCQSSNDAIPTAMHLSARQLLHKELLPALALLRETLAEKANAFDDIVKSGRTHLMDATPVRLGQEFGGYARQVERSEARLLLASEELAEVALGGTATGTGINAHPDFAASTIARLSELYDLEFREAKNHFEAQGAKDACVFLAGTLGAVATSLMKIANDVRWLGSGPTSGLSEIRLPAVQPGSSIMPGKVNPVLSEALMMACARVTGNAVTVTVAGQRSNFELNVMMPVMADALIESISLLAAAARAFSKRCVAGISARPGRASELLERNPSIATALNSYVGYDRAAKVAKKAAREGRSVREVVEEMDILDSASLDRALNVREMTEPGIVTSRTASS